MDVRHIVATGFAAMLFLLVVKFALRRTQYASLADSF